MPHDRSDLSLEEQLRAAPTPPGLIDRLRALPDWPDDQLDREVADVPLPAGWLARLRDIPLDVALDDALREVPVSPVALARARILPDERPGRRWSELAATAALFLLLLGGLWGVIGVAASGVQQQLARRAPTLFVDWGPLQLIDEPLVEDGLSLVAAEPWTPAPPEPSELSEEPPLPAIAAARGSGPFAELAAALREDRLPTDFDVWIERGRLQGEPLAIATPVAENWRPHVPRGIAPPRAPGYDQRFLFSQAAHPIVAPRVDRSLAAVTVPLAPSTESFERVQSEVAQGRWPAARLVRVEEFLAAQEDASPLPAAGTAELRIAAGPSPFGAMLGGLRPHLLRIGVRAGDWAERPRPATHVVIALDCSNTMASPGRWELVRGALEQLAERMGDDDRLSLVALADPPRLVVESVASGERAAWRSAIAQLSPGGAISWEHGLAVAAAAALSEPSTEVSAAEIVVITAGEPAGDDARRQRIAALCAASARHGARLSVIDTAGQSFEPEPHLLAWSRAGEGRYWGAAAAREVLLPLLERLSGGQSLVASDVELHVRFDPEQVAAYRLIGYEPSAASLVADLSTTVDLAPREGAAALFEVWLQPSGSSPLAEVRLTWRNPASGDVRVGQQQVGRSQVSASLAESPPELLAAAIAAETAEVLRQSYYARAQRRTLKDVLDVARRTDAALGANESFARLVRLAEQAAQLRPPRNGR